jgi:hypothetical protein
MKKILGCLLLCANIYSQGPPPPQGVSPFFAIDYDNDGFAQFDIPTSMQSFWIPQFEAVSAQSLSGYDMTVFYEDEPIGPIYTNVIPVEQFNVFIHFEYNGNGPEFVPVQPWVFPLEWHGGLVLVALPHDGDYDGDGISNVAEDSNGNGNLYDDDVDNDGQFDFWDAQAPLAVMQNEDVDFSIFPNPSNDLIHINWKGVVPEYASLEIYSPDGNLVTKSAEIESVNISTLASGIYFVKLTVGNTSVVKKLIVK